METAVGIFDSRERAEQAMKELLEKHVPQESIVFLTRSETEAHTLGKDIGSFTGGFVGGSVGMAAGTIAVAMALVPGIGQVFALGIGATALLGYLGAKTGGAIGKAIGQDAAVPPPTPDEHAPEDAALFVDVLKHGRSLIVVRTEFHDVARAACEVLDRMGLAVPGAAPASARMQTATRQAGGVTVVDVSGRITIGEGNVKLREVVTEVLGKGQSKILLNLSQVEFIDSSGIGELVRSLTTTRARGGLLKLANLNQRLRDTFEAAHLHKVFDIHQDEAAALRSFSESAAGAAGD
jgi:anti-sigma B factor antagonist